MKRAACLVLGVLCASSVFASVGCSPPGPATRQESRRKTQAAQPVEETDTAPEAVEMPYTPRVSAGGGASYLETVVSQPRDVTLKLVLKQWQQAVEAFASFRSRYPDSLDEIRRDEYARTFVPNESKVPSGFVFRYFPQDHQVRIMKRVPVGAQEQHAR